MTVSKHENMNRQDSESIMNLNRPDDSDVPSESCPAYLKDGESRLEDEHGLSLDDDKDAVYPDAKVRLNKEQYSLYQVRRLCEERKEWMLAPDFQRGDVWKPRQKSELIESILMGIPIPVMYLFETREGKKQVVDGRQRITAVLEFLNGKYSLTDLRILPDLNGKNFSALTPKMQGIIEDYQIMVYNIQPPTPERVKYDIFDRVNRGGTRLNSQEMRNALYHGPATEIIGAIAASEEFGRATGKGIDSRRKRDEYVALRILAFLMLRKGWLKTADKDGAPLEYRSDPDDFLAKVMVWINMKSAPGKVEEAKKMIIRSFDRIGNLLGGDAFRFESAEGKRRPINMPLMELLTIMFTDTFDFEGCRDIVERIGSFKRSLDASGRFRTKADSSLNVDWRYGEADHFMQSLKG